MIKLCLLGIDESLSRSLDTALKNRAKDTCSLAKVEYADVVLMDVDKLADKAYWLSVQKDYALPMVAISKSDFNIDQYADIFCCMIKKPLQFSALLNAVTKAIARGQYNISHLQSATQAAAQVSDGERISVSKIIRSNDLVDANEYLLGEVLDAIKTPVKGKCCIIRWWQGAQYLLIDPQLKKVYLSLDKRKFSHVAIIKRHDLDMSQEWVLNRHIRGFMQDACWESSLEDFVWFLTSYTVRTGGLQSLDIDKPHRLTQWPNLVRYSNSEEDLPLANYWVDNTASVTELAEKLSLPMDKVLPFACCCSAIGFLEQQSVQAQHNISPLPSSGGLRKIFSMILHKLAA